MPANRLIFQDAEKARDRITAWQRLEIQRLYLDWAKEIKHFERVYRNKKTASAPYSAMYYQELQTLMIEASNRIAAEAETIAMTGMREVSAAVVNNNTQWLTSLGLEAGAVSASMMAVPELVVQRIVTGQIYQSGWSLSASLWTDSQKTQKQVYEILAGARAMQESVYETANKLERYVNPEKRKPWNLKMADGRKIYPRNVDYASQRLARTMTQHAYQQSFFASVKNNRFVTGIEWSANGSRPCPICQARNGTVFPKDDCPMDHPNGMCTMVPVLMENWKEELLK